MGEIERPLLLRLLFKSNDQICGTRFSIQRLNAGTRNRSVISVPSSYIFPVPTNSYWRGVNVWKSCSVAQGVGWRIGARGCEERLNRSYGSNVVVTWTSYWRPEFRLRHIPGIASECMQMDLVSNPFSYVLHTPLYIAIPRNIPCMSLNSEASVSCGLVLRGLQFVIIHSMYPAWRFTKSTLWDISRAIISNESSVIHKAPKKTQQVSLLFQTLSNLECAKFVPHVPSQKNKIK